MKSFIWHRKELTPQDYLKTNGNSEKSDKKLKKAYKVASDIRKFEIGLFWKRATFFWAFIVSIYTAYFKVLTEIYKIENTCMQKYQHGTIPLVILAALGLFFCFSWLLSSYGSKHWQENWENHIDLLEDSVTGPLYKTYTANSSFSESKLTIAAGWIVTICAFGLLMYEIVSFIDFCLGKKGLLQFVIAFILALIIILLLIMYSEIVKGNQSNCGSISFQLKEYEELNNER